MEIKSSSIGGWYCVKRDVSGILAKNIAFSFTLDAKYFKKSSA